MTNSPQWLRNSFQKPCWRGVFWLFLYSAPTQQCNLQQQHVSALVWDCDISRTQSETRGRQGIHLKAVESRSLGMKPLWVHHCIPRILTRPQTRLISDWVEIPRDRCANVYRWSAFYLLPSSLSLCLSLSALRRNQPCAQREQSLADSKLETERLVMIRGSNWVTGSKDARLFPGLLIQTESKKEAQRHGGGWHTHLQNTGLWETIDQSYNEFPEKCAEKMCAHHWLYTKTYHERASHTRCQNKPPNCWLQDESQIPPALRWEMVFIVPFTERMPRCLPLWYCLFIIIFLMLLFRCFALKMRWLSHAGVSALAPPPNWVSSQPSLGK